MSLLRTRSKAAAVKKSENSPVHRENDEKRVAHLIAKKAANLQNSSLHQVVIDPELVNIIPTFYIRQYRLLPLRRLGDRLILAMTDPSDLYAIEAVEMVTRLRVEVIRAEEEELDYFLHQLGLQYGYADLHNALESLESHLEDARFCLPDYTESQVNENDSVVHLVNSLLAQAVMSEASDIHIEPVEGKLRIRLRIDGELMEIASLPLSFAPAILARVKVLSGLDIAERRHPQDGRLQQIVDNRQVGFRVATLPSIDGEKVVLRVLDRQRSLLNLDNLGMEDVNHRILQRFLQRRHGLILVTGPTGSGKSTSLYAMLHHLNLPGRHIVTLEDPAEYSLSGVTQVQINPRIGLGFAECLRAVLRMDPDVIMVGEIRDVETAGLAVTAALSGHLVFSTLHTTSAVSTVTRLTDMGIEPYLLSSALAGVISQRLIRLLCVNCSEAFFLSDGSVRRLSPDREESSLFYRSVGCPRCGFSGYRGRMAIQEVMEIDDSLRSLINQGATQEELEIQAKKTGMITLREDGLCKARRGLSSIEEILRTLGSH
ncbi:MAG: type II/IV secretion system protein [Syntrophomonadaceae bacterium]|nr:type II/IV secretion system protein [Syntrophomonadaceae bacterium]